MEGSSAITLRLELARFARSHVQGLAASAEEEELVKEAQTFIVEHAGSVLLIVDDVAEPEEIEQLLPRHKASNLPAAHVLMTGHRERQHWPEAMQLTGGHKIDVLRTEESMELLKSGKGLKKVVQQDVELMQRIESFVEDGLDNLAISVAMLKQALGGLDVARVVATMQQFEDDTVGSLQGARVDRSLRGLQGTVSVLVQRAEEACRGDVQLWEATRALLAILMVLDPAGVPDELFALQSSQTSPEEDTIEQAEVIYLAPITLSHFEPCVYRRTEEHSSTQHLVPIPLQLL